MENSTATELKTEEEVIDYTLVNLPLYFLKFEGDYYYQVTTGEEVTKKTLSLSSSSFRRNHPMKFSSSKDCCYHCGSKNHYQSYCPLKKCTHCNLYGHDVTTHHHYQSSQKRQYHNRNNDYHPSATTVPA